MTLLDNISSKTRAIGYGRLLMAILAIGLVGRIAFLAVCPYGLSMDSRSYYIAAINIANGIGYSAEAQAPFEPFYFREPLTAYSYAIVVWLYKLFTGWTPDYPTSWSVGSMSAHHQHIIFMMHILIALLQIVATYIFSKILSERFSKRFALIVTAILAFYPPLYVHALSIFREPYIYLFCALLAFFWHRYLMKGYSWKYLIATGLTGGIICLYLHLYMYLVPILAVILCTLKALSWKRKMAQVIALAVLFVAPSVPWMIRVYNYYPDIRICRTFGSALSTDYTNALNSYRANGVDPYYVKEGDLPGCHINTSIYRTVPASDVFRMTFDGTYKREAQRLNAYNTTDKIVKYYIGRIIEAFRNTVFIVGITYDYGIFLGHFSAGDFAKFIFCLPALLFGVLAVIGLCLCFTKYWRIMPVFIYHALVFFAFGDEERRVYIIVPYIICLALYTVWFVYQRRRG